jgi:hypothetical protein
MKYARLLAEPRLVGKALEMAEYGSRLPTELQYAGEPPFEDLYAAHRQWFQATLGRGVDAAVEYFAQQASGEVDASLSTMAIEAYIALLVRVGRPGEALEAADRLIPSEGQLSRHAPTLLELAELSGRWDRYAAICKARNDLLGFTAGLLAQQQALHSKP